jgi:uridine kinase
VVLGGDAAAVAALVARSAPSAGEVRVVCVDGPAGAGKTTLAEALVCELAPSVGWVPVVHGDEVYEGWPVVVGADDRVAAFAQLADRLDAWLIGPWSRGEPGSHPVWDWYAGACGPRRVVAPAPVVILEGVALASAPLRTRASVSIWVDTRGDRLGRVLARDGEQVRDEMLDWQRDERRWFELDSTRAGCTVRLTT